MFVFVIWLSLYSSFSFFPHLSMFSAPLPLTKKTAILSNYDHEVTNLYVYTNTEFIRIYKYGINTYIQIRN